MLHPRGPSSCALCDGPHHARALCKPHYDRARRYGLTISDLRLVDTEDACAVCGGPAEVVDHDHVTGRVRGVLCNRCNRGIGLLGDSAPALMLAALYLVRTTS